MGSRAKALAPRKTPRQSRARFTMEQILEAAAHVFTELGYAGGTTNHIAARAGVSVGSLYQYFPNKEAILVALVEQHMQSGAAALQALLDEALRSRWSVEETLERFVRATVGLHTEAPRLHHVLVYEAPRPPSVVALLHGLEEIMARGVERLLVERVGAQIGHARHVAYVLVHVVDSLAHEFVLHPPTHMDEDAFVAEVVTMLSAYLLQPCPDAMGTSAVDVEPDE